MQRKKKRVRRRHQFDHTRCCLKQRSRRLLMESLEDRRVLATFWSVDIDEDVTWTNEDVHYITADISVLPNVTLTIDPGTIVQFDRSVGLTVQGTLKALGTPSEPILFTADQDDTGFDGELGTADDTDTEGNGPTTAFPAYWDPLQFVAGSTGSMMQHVEFRFGGNANDAQIVVDQGELTLSDGLLLNGKAGIRINEASPVISNVHIAGHVREAARMDLASNPEFTAVTTDANGVNGLQVIGGDLPASTSWDDPTIVYTLLGDVTVPEGMTLTVGAGQTVKMGAGGNNITVNGTLMAEGTNAEPIIFTSYRDDSASNDTNGDGETSGFANDWGDIEFTSTSTGSVMSHVELRNGGRGGERHQLTINGGELTLINSLVRDGERGILIRESDPTITNVTLQGNRFPAASMDLMSNPTIRGFTAVGNGQNGLALLGDSIPSNALWDDPDVVYLPTEPITVPAGVTLTIDEGQVVKWGRVVDALIVQGTLLTQGTTANPVVFTSTVDDSIGGDSNGDGPSGGFSGAWGRIELTDTSIGNTLDGLHLRYGAHGGNSHQLFVNGGELTLTNSMLFAGDRGLEIRESNPVIRNVEFRNQKWNAARADVMSDPDFENVTFENNGTNGVEILGGSLSSDLTWDDPEVVYLAIGDITVPTGTTLTIADGQIVKFGRRGDGNNITVEGTLLAEGTSDNHIIFTSYRDDSAGGDTDNSGPSSGSRGDWERIQVNEGGEGRFDHVDFRFAGRSIKGNPSLLYVDGGEATVTDSILRESRAHGILIAGGNVNVSGSLIAHNRVAALEVIGAGELIATNNTLDHNRFGLTLGEGNVTLTNNLITGAVELAGFEQPAGLNVFDATGLVAKYNNVYVDPYVNYSGISDLTGIDGNISVDPKYFSADAFQYSLRGGSPVIDAGTSDGAPTTDFYGNPRFDDPNVPNRGGGAMPYVDMGAIERQETATSDMDLATVAVTGPDVGIQGEVVSVSWTNRNAGTGAAVGLWHDAIYLSADRIWTPDDQLLGDSQYAGDLGPGATYDASAEVMLPGALPGDYYFIVRTNSRNEIFEALALENNTAAAVAPITVDLPILPFDTPTEASLTSAGDATWFKILTPAGADLTIDLAGPDGATNELYVSFGDLPNRQSFESRGIRPGSADQTISLAGTKAGTYFVMVYGSDLASPETFTLTASLSGFSLKGVTPVQGSNRGSATIAVRGAQFVAGSTVRLIDRDGTTIDPEAVFFTDSGLITATFDLTGIAAGPADVQVTNPDGTTQTLPDAFNIVDGVPGRFEARVTVPNRVRLGRSYEVLVEYSNPGDTDIPSPVMRLTGEGVSELSFSEDVSSTATSLDLIAVNPDGPAGVLPPGATGTIRVFAKAADIGDESFVLSVAKNSSDSIDWNALKSGLRPDGISDADWDDLFAEFQQIIGNTWDSYEQVIADHATLLPSALGFNHSLNDVFRLILRRAFANLSTSIHGSVFLHDLEHPAANVPLTFVDDTGESPVVHNTVSLTDGTFFVPQVDAGTYDVQSDTFAITNPEQTTVASDDVTGLSLVVENTGKISGSVMLSPIGIPLIGQIVSIDSEQDAVVPFSGFATTGRDGRYSLSGLPPGTYTVSTGGDRYARFQISEVVVEAGQARSHVNLVVQTAGSISGTVSGPGGPVQDATVTAFGADNEAYIASTDELGQYRITGVAGQDYQVQASSPGLYSDAVQDLSLASGQFIGGIDLSLATAGQVDGTTAYSSGVAVPAVFVSLTNADHSFVTQSGDDGRFVFDDLPPGDFTFGTFSFTGDLLTVTQPVTVTAGQTATLEITVYDAGVVTGTIRNEDGDPLANVETYVTDGTFVHASTVTDAQGVYRLTNLDAGNYFIVLGDPSRPGIVSKEVTIDALNREAVIDFSVGVTGSVSGTVFAADSNTPVPYVEVTLTDGLRPIASVTSDAQGAYKFSILNPGDYRVQASNSADTFPSIPITINADTNLAGQDLSAGDFEIRGMVRDANGTPIENATVDLVQVTPGFVREPGVDVTTDENGEYSFASAVPGDYQVTVRAAGMATANREVTVVDSNMSDVDFDLNVQSQLSGTVTDAQSGSRIADGLILLRHEGNNELSSSASTDESGNFSVVGLAAGTYTPTALHSNYETAVLPKIVVGQEYRIANVTLNPSTSQIHGRVTNGTSPVGHATITATNNNGLVVVQTRSHADGTFTLNALPPGTHAVVASAEGHLPSADKILTVNGGDNITDFDLSLTLVTLPLGPTPSPDVQTSGVTATPSAQLAEFEDTRVAWIESLQRQLIRGGQKLALIPDIETVAFFELNEKCADKFPASAAIILAYNTYNYWKAGFNMYSSARAAAAELARKIGETSSTNDGSKNPTLSQRIKSLPMGTIMPIVEKYIPNGPLKPGVGLNAHNEGEVGDFKKLFPKISFRSGNDASEAQAVKAAVVQMQDELTAIRVRIVAGPSQLKGVSAKVEDLRKKADLMARMFLRWGSSDTNALEVTMVANGHRQDFKDYIKTGGLSGFNVFSDLETTLTQEVSSDPDVDSTAQGTPLQFLLDSINVFETRQADFNSKIRLALYVFAELVDCTMEPSVSPPKDPPSCKANGSGSGSSPQGPEPEQRAETEQLPVEFFSMFGECKSDEDTTDGPAIGQPYDPNDKTGPGGFGPEAFMHTGVLPYLIEFENDPDVGATIPAQEVVVTDTLDDDLDLSTFEFVSFGFDNREFQLPAGLFHYETIIDLRPENVDLLVPVILDVDPSTRMMSATFGSLDPLTGLPPDDVDAGFLPVNDKALHNGEGFIRYRVQPLPDLPTGTEIRNQALIKFDINKPIPTPETVHTIDHGQPTSTVSAMDEAYGTASFMVDWSGEDDSVGSGIAGYHLYVSQDDEPFQHVVTTSETSYEFTGGVSGSTYSFISLARDNVGNVESMPTVADTETLVIIGAWINKQNRFDVNGKDGVTSLDALLVINELGRELVFDPKTRILTPLPPQGYAPPYYDVTKDGMITALDALQVINERRRLSVFEGEAAGEQVMTVAYPLIPNQRQTVPLDRSVAEEEWLSSDASTPTLLTTETQSAGASARAFVLNRNSPSLTESEAEEFDWDLTLNSLADDVAQQWALIGNPG